MDTEKELQIARQKLLDLTLRNRLLNSYPSKLRTIRIIDEIPGEVYDVLVLHEKAMGFRPQPQNVESSQLNSGKGKLSSDHADTEDISEEDSVVWELPPPDAEVEERHRDSFLQTTLDAESLQKRIFYISQESQSVLEEQGYTVLYLALGFLEWTEISYSSETLKAPLILVPVELERERVGKPFKLHYDGGEISTNISLQAKLAVQEVELPDFEKPEDKESVDEYFKSVHNAISKKPNWKITNDIWLGFFSFTKFVMYKDLDPAAWPKGKSPAEHPLIRAIFDSGYTPVHDKGFSEEEVDEKLTAHDVYHVVDADPSQIAVIEDVKSGRNLVVEGPPGTGKSQTIVNIIAELLAAGKTVLFVSEKMAALEVVKSRLDGVGLGDFCLELHSRKSNKHEVLKELERVLSNTKQKYKYTEEELDRLDERKRELNDYVKALKEPFGNLRKSPYELYGLKEAASRHFQKIGRDMPRTKFTDSHQYTPSQLEFAGSALANLIEIIPSVSPIANNPWSRCTPKTITLADEEDIRGSLIKCKESLNRFETRTKDLVEVCGTKYPNTLNELADVLNAARVISTSIIIDENVLLNQEWNKPNIQAEALISDVESVQHQQSRTLSTFQFQALNSDIFKLLVEYKAISKIFLRFFNIRRYYRLKRDILKLYKDSSVPKKNNQIITDLEQLADYLRLLTKIKTSENVGRSLFGSYWQGERSDPQLLRRLAKWIVSFREQTLAGTLTNQAVSLVSAGKISQLPVEKLINDVDKTAKDLSEQHDSLFKQVGTTAKAIFGVRVDNIILSDLRSRLEVWGNQISKLQLWSQFVARRNDCLKSIASPMIDLIDRDSIHPEDIIPCLKGNLADELLRLVFRERPVLANFIGQIHEQKIRDFRELDRRVIELNRYRLIQQAYKQMPQIWDGASPNSAMGILKGEFNRKRGHKPIRKLMIGAGSLIQQIKPCFMMSPLSIAQFLDPRTISFDVIIFDEASQVRPEDALGALLRGKQLAVMGDTKQLPPTSFFDNIIESENEEEDSDSIATIKDIESIMRLCRKNFPKKRLQWHYRSKHESLIIVSNREFYDNGLLIYPSPFKVSKDLGLQFVHLPHTKYDRGRSAVNREEARAVAEAAIEHYRNFPGKSLGIGAFSVKQQEAIVTQLDLVRKFHPEMEDYFSRNKKDYCFVKNLETIQGDERDVIFLTRDVNYMPIDRRRQRTYLVPRGDEHELRPIGHLLERIVRDRGRSLPDRLCAVAGPQARSEAGTFRQRGADSDPGATAAGL